MALEQHQLKAFLAKLVLMRSKRVKDWTDEESQTVRDIISNEFKTEGELRSEVQMSIKRLMDIACYRGLRHRRGLPVRGQQTKNNSRTSKG